jgi:tetratricopeptide (TPR) repeat protein
LLAAGDSTEPHRRALLGEILLELGRYDEAAAIFRTLEDQTSRLPVAARLARWYELTGRLGHARNVMRYALRRVVDEDRVGREQEAWFHLRLGEIELKMGAVERAESLFVSGLRRFPGDYRLLGGLATAAARRQDWPAAIDAGERAIAIQLDPVVLGVLSEAYAALGDWMQSASYARAMRASALSQPGPIHRAWGLFLLDHGDDAQAVLERARRELATRRDVYGYDLVAWALHALGRDARAWAFMERALAQGTEDALLFHHAAEIARATGNPEAARRFALRAVGLNSRFHPTHVARARAIAATSSEPGVANPTDARRRSP